jgi:hypothetical protein
MGNGSSRLENIDSIIRILDAESKIERRDSYSIQFGNSSDEQMKKEIEDLKFQLQECREKNAIILGSCVLESNKKSSILE